ncbi:hypothetical protein HDIA_3378 [Hartmannibacter diazotrophicus]|uniref:Periplasmic protein n=1 Tax=Hartmannibacter diazotrophicus TaxID=1482074 RepID=A0A2C9D9Q7_9HYPH|nr:hypothetical protein [Hartmannibacter diazotrophicus]SON56919.1 hypothetical protein HDIA_3378 [Hartmannibacter diazotrophicus]
MKSLLAACLLASAIALPTASFAEEAAHVKPVTDYVTANVKPWLSDPAVIEAVKKSNEAHAKTDYFQIKEMDDAWKESKGGEPMAALMANDLSTFLKAKRSEAGDVITEAFVMDAAGLNVGQTDGTGDYFQGDEAKWQKTYAAGPDAIFIDEVEEDGGKNIAQASLSISDGGKAIGAITIGIDVDKLK